MFHKRRRQATSPSERQRTPSGWHQEDWQSYDPVADEYDRSAALRHEPPGRDLVELAGVTAGDRLLDVGAGTGVATAPAVEAVGDEGLAVGLDPAPRMLGLARRRAPVARFVVGEALDLPFRGEAFDRVVANFVISHFNRYETGLFDMFRVLRSGGTLAVSNWGAVEDEFGRAWRETAEALVGKDLFRDAVRRAIPWQEHFSKPDNIKQALHRVGLRNLQVHHRSYRFEMTLDSYLAGQESRMVARSLHRIMGDAIWERFRTQVAEEFRSRFRDPIGDTRDVWFGVGTRR